MITLDMSRQPPQRAVDLTTPEAVAVGQQVYNRITSGRCTDVAAELNGAYGRMAAAAAPLASRCERQIQQASE
ncbi:hypothetical protein [Streptomyces sp. YIM 121038]|uniref:hypothetical protein n=1 Tax=Streptomyces sp. YIM 121038 TaxID=2136401 RepID=UPI002016F33A|nr:hypothetical protein [Streptomyces sp. YIM 121038]